MYTYILIISKKRFDGREEKIPVCFIALLTPKPRPSVLPAVCILIFTNQPNQPLRPPPYPRNFSELDVVSSRGSAAPRSSRRKICGVFLFPLAPPRSSRRKRKKRKNRTHSTDNYCQSQCRKYIIMNNGMSGRRPKNKKEKDRGKKGYTEEAFRSVVCGSKICIIVFRCSMVNRLPPFLHTRSIFIGWYTTILSRNSTTTSLFFNTSLTLSDSCEATRISNLK